MRSARRCTTPRAVTRIVATKANGVKDVLRLHTSAGYTLDVTADHLVWRCTDRTSGRFVPAGTLRPEDQLEWHRRPSYGEAEIDARKVAEAALAGWLQSDGFVGQYASGTNRSLTIEAMTVTDAELAWVTSALDVVFPSTHRHERSVETQDAQLDCRRTRLYGEDHASLSSSVGACWRAAWTWWCQNVSTAHRFLWRRHISGVCSKQRALSRPGSRPPSWKST